MVRKQDLVAFLKDRPDNISLETVLGFVDKKEKIGTIGFAQGSIFIEKNVPKSFTDAEHLEGIIRSLELDPIVIAKFNTLSRAKAQLVLAVIKIFVEKLKYSIKGLNHVEIKFVKRSDNFV